MTSIAAKRPGQKHPRQEPGHSSVPIVSPGPCATKIAE